METVQLQLQPEHLIVSWSGSPGVLNQQGADEVHSQGGDALEGVLRVVHVDLGDVEERLLLVVAQEGRLARQHDVGQDPDAPGRWEGEDVKRPFVMSMVTESAPGLICLPLCH